MMFRNSFASRRMEPLTTTPTPTAPAAVPHPTTKGAHEGNKGLLLIAVFELVKTVLFLIAAAGMFHLVNRDTQLELRKLLHVFRISGDSHFVAGLLPKAADFIDPHKLSFTGLLVLYAALHATEGIGLLLKKRWAEYITVIMTGFLIPYEIYILIHHTTHSKIAPLVPPDQKWIAIFSQHLFLLKVLVLLGNVAIVAYLIYHLRRHQPHPLTERPDAA